MSTSARFDEGWGALRCVEDEVGWSRLGDVLRVRHEEPHRAYHGVEHVLSVSRCLTELVGGPVPTELGLGAFFHDAVYDPLRPDNEARSAQLASEALSGLGVAPPVVEKTVRIVEATVRHAASGDRTIDTFLDADLSILGSPVEAYDRYAEAIRSEYGHLDAETYRRGRAEVLAAFLARPRLFLTAVGRERFEETARRNLARELGRLTPG